MFKKLKLASRWLLGFIVSVRVYDNYVENYRPALLFRNKIRYSLGQWIPIGKDSPFGRLTYIRGIGEDGTHFITYSRLSDMGKEFRRKPNGTLFRITHWQDPRISKT